MLTIGLGLATALVYGFADFFGAIGSKKLRPILVTALAAFGGLGLLVVLTTFFGFRAEFGPETFLWGIIGGIFSAIGLSSLYAALAEGPISILSPLSAVVSALVPAVFGVITGETFSWLGWLAIFLVLIAIVLVAYVPNQEVRMPSWRGILFGVTAGLGIGMVLIAFDQTPAAAGLGTVILVRAINGGILIATALLLIASNRASFTEFKALSARFWLVIVAAGFCDATANVLFSAAVKTGSFTVVSVLTALYPLGTILLAFLVLKERVAKSQLIGIGLALGACVLLAV